MLNLHLLLVHSSLSALLLSRVIVTRLRINNIGNTTFGMQNIPVTIKISLPTNFPASAPAVNLLFPKNPNYKLQPHDYLIVNEVRIPYLLSWNLASNPQPNIVRTFNNVPIVNTNEEYFKHVCI